MVSHRRYIFFIGNGHGISVRKRLKMLSVPECPDNYGLQSFPFRKRDPVRNGKITAGPYIYAEGLFLRQLHVQIRAGCKEHILRIHKKIAVLHCYGILRNGDPDGAVECPDLLHFR